MIPSASLIVRSLQCLATRKKTRALPIQLRLLLLALDRIEGRARCLRRRVHFGFATREIHAPESAVRLQVHEKYVGGLLGLVRREHDVTRRIRLEDPQALP